jgi:hypothetical protein
MADTRSSPIDGIEKIRSVLDGPTVCTDRVTVEGARDNARSRGESDSRLDADHADVSRGVHDGPVSLGTDSDHDLVGLDGNG